MVSSVMTFAFQGVDTIPVEVQAHFSSGMAGIHIVGLADKAVAESRERIRAAFSCMNLGMPQHKITINLCPADLAKEGSYYDLPIAVAILTEAQILQQHEVKDFFFIGELGLDGSMRQVTGALPAAISAYDENKGLICPNANANEAAFSANPLIFAPNNLVELINHFKNTQLLKRQDAYYNPEPPVYPDISDIKGQNIAKRALEIAAAGGHNLLMIGPPGSGKSMLAKRLPGILPEMDAQEMLETSVIASIAGHLKEGNIITQRPFRAPHSSSSMPAMVGGGRDAKPGEVTLAHNGVLFLDELPEYQRIVLESLRQPVEDGKITIARANCHLTYPAKFQLIAAMNPCRCGYFGDPKNGCNRMPSCADEYQNKISGPLLDRFDIRLEVPAMKINKDITAENVTTTSSQIKQRVMQARQIQRERYKNSKININAHADGEFLSKLCILSPKAEVLLLQAVDKFNLSMRGYHRILRVARSIADLEAKDEIIAEHISEALYLRQANNISR